MEELDFDWASMKAKNMQVYEAYAKMKEELEEFKD